MSLTTIIASEEQVISSLITKAIKAAIPEIANELRKQSVSTTIKYVSRAEYAKRNGISIQLVDKLRRQGKIEYKKVGRRMLIRVDNA